MSRKSIMILIGGAAFVIVALALVAGAVVTTAIARAETSRAMTLFQEDEEPFLPKAPLVKIVEFAGPVLPELPGMLEGPDSPGMPGRIGDGEYLAQALGITVEELEEAYKKAHDAALDQAVTDGLLTQEEADAIRTLRESEGEMGRGLKHRFFFFIGRGDVDFEALLADALGITAEELQEARAEARQLAIDAAVEDGKLTQEQADMMTAMAALKGAIDPQALTAQVLGISAEELQELRGERGAFAKLLEEKGLTPEEFRTQMREAYEAAVQQAVDDGVITQEQADKILSGEIGIGRGGFFGGRGHGGRGRPFGPGGLLPDSAYPEPSAPTAPSDGSTGTGA